MLNDTQYLKIKKPNTCLVEKKDPLDAIRNVSGVTCNVRIWKFFCFFFSGC